MSLWGLYIRGLYIRGLYAMMKVEFLPEIHEIWKPLYSQNIFVCVKIFLAITRTQVLELGPRDGSLLWSGLIWSVLVMMHWWCTDDALIMCWWCTDDVLMMHWWCTDDALIMHWWCTNDALMMRRWCNNDELMMHWWCIDDALMMHWCTGASG